ncbi:MAG: hypothetical protein ACTSUO_07000 [Candidatus Thorarchaeota archaeon]
MLNVGKEKEAAHIETQISRSRARRLGFIFILLEASLIVSVSILYFAQVREEYKWPLVGVMVLTSILGMLFAWFIDGASKEIWNYQNGAGPGNSITWKPTVLLPVALGVATLVIVILLNPDTGPLTYFVGLIGGVLVWYVSAFFLWEAGSAN